MMRMKGYVGICSGDLLCMDRDGFVLTAQTSKDGIVGIAKEIIAKSSDEVEVMVQVTGTGNILATLASTGASIKDVGDVLRSMGKSMRDIPPEHSNCRSAIESWKGSVIGYEKGEIGIEAVKQKFLDTVGQKGLTKLKQIIDDSIEEGKKTKTDKAIGKAYSNERYLDI